MRLDGISTPVPSDAIGLDRGVRFGGAAERRARYSPNRSSNASVRVGIRGRAAMKARRSAG